MPAVGRAPAAAGLPESRRVRWQQACRIVPTRHPTISLFDRVADAEDFDALYALEAMSNERVRDELGEVERVPRADRVYGPGSGPIMAAFTHVNLLGSRFSAGDWGVFYAARERATAVAETRHHHARFLAATRQGPMHLPMRLYRVAIDARLHEPRQRDGGGTGEPQPPAQRRREPRDDQHHGHAVQHAEADPAARKHPPRTQADQQCAAGHLGPAAPEARPALRRLQRHRLAEPGAEQEQADDDGALARPEGVVIEILPWLDEAEEIEIEAEVEDRHPDDRRAAQRVQAVETSHAHSVFS